jgi:hypothetical protein
MATCSTCGNRTEEGTRFCKHCGSRIAAADAATTSRREADDSAPGRTTTSSENHSPVMPIEVPREREPSTKAEQLFRSLPGGITSDRILTPAQRQRLEAMAKDPEKLIEALSTREIPTRAHAALALAKADHPEVLNALLRALKQPWRWVRAAALLALAEGRHEFAIPKIVDALGDSEAAVRFAAVHALGSLWADSAVPELLRLLDDEDEDIFHAACQALALLGSFDLPEVQKRITSGQVPRDIATAMEAQGAKPQVLVPLLQSLHARKNPRKLQRLIFGFLCVDVILVGALLAGVVLGVSMLANSGHEERWLLMPSESGTSGSSGSRTCLYDLSGRPVDCFELPAIPELELRRVPFGQKYEFPSAGEAVSSHVFTIGAPVLFFLYLWWGNARGGTLGKGVCGLEVVRKGPGADLGPARGLVRTVGYIFAPLSLLPGPHSIWQSNEWLHDKLAGSQVQKTSH